MIIAIYNHEYGNDVRVFSSIESALNWRNEIANDYWNEHYYNDIKPDNDIGAYYFANMTDNSGFCESFEIIENVIIED
jgi:hypothetical protein